MRVSLRRWWPVVIVLTWVAVALAFATRPSIETLFIAGISAAVLCVALAALLLVAFVAKRGQILAPIVVALMLALVVGVFISGDGVMCVRFALSRDELAEACRSSVQGSPPAAPARIGLFDVRSIIVDGGIVRMTTSGSGSSEEGIAFFPVELSSQNVDGYDYIPLAWHNGAWYRFVRYSDSGT